MHPTLKTTVLGTGLTGLVGSRVVSLLSTDFEWINLDIAHPTHPVDITQPDSLRVAISQYEPSALLHCAAFTDVTGAWQQSGDKNGLCYRVNVMGTRNIAQVCQEFGIHLIHLSTAYVFDGQKPTSYLEQDRPNPIEWYGQTKLWAEEMVQEVNSMYTILRIDQPFRPDPFPKLDAVHRVIEGLKNGTLYPQFTDHTFGPTSVDSLADIIRHILTTKVVGLYHATNGESWSDYAFAAKIAQLMKHQGKIKKSSLDEYLNTTNRPYQRNTALNSSRLLSQLSHQVKSISQALQDAVMFSQ